MTMTKYQATSKGHDFTEPITIALGVGPDRQDILEINVLPRDRAELAGLLKLVLDELHAAQGAHAERVTARRQAAATARQVAMIQAIARPPATYREVKRDENGRILGVLERPQLPTDAA